MIEVFVDTSAFYAALDRDDQSHERARGLWADLLEQDARLVTTNYVAVETLALVQRRLGQGALATFSQDILPLVDCEWVSETDHAAALGALLAANRRDLSFVDLVSFHVMRRVGLPVAFAFDGHFEEQGFEAYGSA